MIGQRFALIGGGLVGLATGLKLLRSRPGAHLLLLEKEAAVGQHQSGHNSGVLHAGLYYAPGSLKARLAVSGIQEMVEFCREHSVPHEICGKLVVATDAAEVDCLRRLHQRGLQNGLQGLRWLEQAEMREIEPHVGGIAALHVPQEGIVDYPAVAQAIAREIQRLGGEVRTGAQVCRLACVRGEWRISTPVQEFTADYLINCAGLHSDRVSAWAGESRDVRIIPFRGEYYRLRLERQFLVRNLIYPVPDPQFPFLGVHFTRLIGGGIEAGPNAVLALAREGYRKTDIVLQDLFDALSYPGLWRFLKKHRRMSWAELKRSLSKRRFCESLQKLVPEIAIDDLSPGGAGVRAQAMTRSGDLVQDFSIVQREHALHLLNAPSPAATASLAIGSEIVHRLSA